ncbi:hypothetical protein CHARACLAT_024548 [Characodon lateralis]|uniref:Uncharacterized protein n=1 Tax=Characodon lateralis TaxID=208331 RepID=A0ABU7EYZ1_9TELE|nr:hypothetical protein [Characodon lateralis]
MPSTNCTSPALSEFFFTILDNPKVLQRSHFTHTIKCNIPFLSSCHLLTAVALSPHHSLPNSARPRQPLRTLSHPRCPQPMCVRWAQMWQKCPVVLEAVGC